MTTNKVNGSELDKLIEEHSDIGEICPLCKKGTFNSTNFADELVEGVKHKIAKGLSLKKWLIVCKQIDKAYNKLKESKQ